MGHMHVVEVCRGQQSFSGACRGDNDRMSWNTTMSWMHVVEHMLFQEHVVGTDVVCRGYQYVVGACRGEQSFYGACRGW